jgi:hypothetical protein
MEVFLGTKEKMEAPHRSSAWIGVSIAIFGKSGVGKIFSGNGVTVIVLTGGLN